MAEMYVAGSLNMADPPWIEQLEGTVTEFSLTIDSGPVILTAEGPIDLDAGNNLVGTVYRVDFFIKPNATGWWINGLSFNARTLQDLLETGSPGVLQAALLAGNDRITIGEGARGLALGYAGNDTFTARIAASTRIDGGTGSDTFAFDSNADSWGVLQNAARLDLSTGRATLLSPTTGAVVTLVSIENLRGGVRDDVLIGNAAANRLDGGEGFDIAGWTNVGSPVLADLRTGTATSQGSVDTLVAVEGLLGGLANDTLRGDSAANLLDGAAGADSLVGGGGDDTFGVDQSGDRVVDGVDGGFDTVRATLSWTLGTNLEGLVLVGSLARDGTGNTLANRITGNAEANRLKGLAGDDTLLGGGGDDTLGGGSGRDSMDGGAGSDLYLVDGYGDETADGGTVGTDTVHTTSTYVLGPGIEVAVLLEDAPWITNRGLTGNELANRLVGNGDGTSLSGSFGADTLIGGGGGDSLTGGPGADTLIGGTGNDVYQQVDASDTIIELAGQGTDELWSVVDGVVLPETLENLLLFGTLGGIGNARANVLRGNHLDNRLDGAGGADTLVGSTGNDTYLVDHVDDVVEESIYWNEGVDQVRSGVGFTLPVFVENLLLTGTATIDGRGNALDNLLVGNAAANRLDGGAGADTLRGDAGDDTYVVGAGDVVVEASVGSGIDSVVATADFVLPQYVEHLTLSGAGALSGIGNGAANRVTGNAVANTLEGGTGADTLTGYGGNDTLDGGTGSDTMSGGLGDDVFVLSGAGDRVVEAVDGGVDTVRAAVDVDLAVVAAGGVERVELLGGAAVSASGDAGANHLVGNAGDNRLDGRDGADTLTGGAGADRFVLGGGAVDTLVDFATGVDRIALLQATLPVGNGDAVVDAAELLAGSGGFSAGAELVIATDTVADAQDAAAVAARFGSAASAYTTGRSALFVAGDAEQTAVWRFVSAGDDAEVTAGELQLVAVLETAALLAIGDFVFLT